MICCPRSLRFMLVQLVACLPAFSQQSNTLYLMHPVPQSNMMNPAVQISCRYYVGLPVLGSVYLNYSNTAFTYRDLAGSDSWNIEGIEGQMHRRDLYTAEFMASPIALGYRHRSDYFTFNITERAVAYQIVPGDLAGMAVYGNGPFIGETVPFNGLRTGAYHLREYALGYSRKLDPYLAVGIRAKLMFGKAGASTGRSRLSVRTADDNFGLVLNADYTVNSSFPYTINFGQDSIPDGIEFDPEDLDPVQYMLNRGNPGLGVDLGLIYRYNEKTTLSASLLDVGILRWRTDLNNITGTGDYAYDGADLTSQLVSADFLEEAIDSILSSLDVVASEEPYSYVLPAQLFLGGSYQYSETFSFGVVNRNVLFRSKLHSSFTLSATAGLANRFLATLSWSYLNNSLKNVGVGIAYHGNGFQLHAVTDNLLGYLYPFNTRNIGIRFGMNLMLGCPRNKRERLLEDAYGALPGGICPYPENPERKREKRIRAARKRNR